MCVYLAAEFKLQNIVHYDYDIDCAILHVCLMIAKLC